VKPHAFHPEADAEYSEAAKYYSKINPELGGRFYDEIERLIAEACATPPSYRMIHPSVHRHFTFRFPYGIIFAERPDDIWILAVMHLHREPTYWKKRLTNP
jgi:plasmid stabilization system protein ParE